MQGDPTQTMLEKLRHLPPDRLARLARHVGAVRCAPRLRRVVAGDQVRETAGTNVFVYEVNAPGGQPPFRYSDPYRRVLRIHTKHIATE